MVANNEFSTLLSDIGKRAAEKPVKERLQTHALGDDPLPIVTFDISDKGTFTLDLTREKPPFVSKGVSPAANLRIETDWHTAQAIMDGKVDPWEAGRKGDVRFFGKMRLAHALQRYVYRDVK